MKSIKIRPYIPERLEIDEVSPNHIRLHAYPFEPNFAVTVAHPIRRLLLSCCVGYAPTAIKIDGVAHEFDSVRGVAEDVAPFISNLKNLNFKINDDFKKQDKFELDYEFDGQMELLGKHLSNEIISVIDADSHLASINAEAKLKFSLIIQKGIGYVPSEDIRESVGSDYIPLDAYFTPVKKAVYEIQNVLHESNPNFEKIVFDIETNGQVEPMDAFKEAVGIMHSQMSVFGAELSDVPTSNNRLNDDSPELKTLLSSVEILNLEHRPSNCLQKSNIKYIGELVLMNESELKNIKNLGKRSFDEITQKLAELGYNVGQELPNDLAITLNKRLAKLKA
ncbi:DNA-directed RNA polymerase subunit alpha [Helicobacter saguini]|uniref:DNA-directed RNA polymerase subunit alpha n=1 Tax=Helicobacter saguini TaxID=1548018 RepID=A0A347VN04_9HELI|nr:DNA-directed RNA polymerase subunit alpha [Helicobacter saguini]MWV61953.1 DNA-directed RNA polymerase subunit alpha [Helicobacter saguini]MWV67372.1 DNA-directed RNA polymerase subunit alpha [Helicobacter saguini]MWV69725.1 DNA-directed RNA polymerase subunit alpha [Helicobacter saguini]MWV73058.1 DNA-directed RNA polymerase subunit alpha [Helicobacter saguini]TLD95568.1 DNA-directed RNA polymerase subunit alpha [Helicobacter saguini]